MSWSMRLKVHLNVFWNNMFLAQHFYEVLRPVFAFPVKWFAGGEFATLHSIDIYIINKMLTLAIHISCTLFRSQLLTSEGCSVLLPVQK